MARISGIYVSVIQQQTKTKHTKYLSGVPMHKSPKGPKQLILKYVFIINQLNIPTSSLAVT